VWTEHYFQLDVKHIKSNILLRTTWFTMRCWTPTQTAKAGTSQRTMDTCQWVAQCAFLLPRLRQYQIILFGDRGSCASVARPGPYSRAQWVRVAPTTSHSRVRRATVSKAIEPRVPEWEIKVIGRLGIHFHEPILIGVGQVKQQAGGFSDFLTRLLELLYQSIVLRSAHRNCDRTSTLRINVSPIGSARVL